jgi:hypothetical protein
MATGLQADATGVSWIASSSPGVAVREGSASRELSIPAEFPFELREGLIWVQVKAPEASQPLNFLLDTGAGVSVVNLRTARKLGLPLGKQVQVLGVGANSVGYWPQRLSASAGAVALARDYLAVDLNELSGACRCAVDGLIGADFFRGRVIQIDFVAKKVRLLAEGEPAGESMPLRVRRGALEVPVSVNNAAAGWARLDTGCASSLQWTAAEGKKTEGKTHIGAGRAQVMAVGLAGVSIPMEPARVQLGAYIFDKVPAGMHTKPIFAGEAGLLGNGLLSRFERVTIDAKSGRLLVEGGPAGKGRQN